MTRSIVKDQRGGHLRDTFLQEERAGKDRGTTDTEGAGGKESNDKRGKGAAKPETMKFQKNAGRPGGVIGSVQIRKGSKNLLAGHENEKDVVVKRKEGFEGRAPTTKAKLRGCQMSEENQGMGRDGWK